MHIVFICGAYPSKNYPQKGVFVQQFAWAMARFGHRCTVICPTSIFKKKELGFGATAYEEEIPGGGRIQVLRPDYLSASSKQIGPFHSGRLTQQLFERAVLRSLTKLPVKADILYGVFLYHGGKTAAWCGQQLGIPAVVEVGEGTFWSITPFGTERAGEELAAATAFRALGGHLRRELITQLHLPPEHIAVIPNGVDRDLFQPGDKLAAREKLGLKADIFLVLFVGTFNEAKGGPKLLAAVEQIPDCHLAMIGGGPLEFKSERLVFKGTLPHGELPLWYQAADIFVLPTQIEGSCNAAIEAMCCGLPLVTSKGEHMADIADESNALVVDETQVGEICQAIRALKNNSQLRQKLGAGSLAKAARFDINSRAQEVTGWFEQLLKSAK